MLGTGIGEIVGTRETIIRNWENETDITLVKLGTNQLFVFHRIGARILFNGAMNIHE